MYNGPIIDCDVHHTWPSDSDLVSYMPKRWADYVRDSGVSIFPAKANFTHPGGADRRLDSFPVGGGPPGSDYTTMRTQLLDGMGVSRAILGYNSGQEVAHPNPYLATAIARAANDFTLDRWLDDRDDRLYGKILVANHLPEQAAAEVRRIGKHPRMIEVLMSTSGLGLPFGHPAYHPIYAAAADLGLTIGIHIGGGNLNTNFLNAGGLSSTRIQFFTLHSQAVMHHLLSFITYGVFEQFPALRLMLIEVGVAWVPWMLLELDAQYANWRSESDWVRRLPSEYMRDHVRLTTQPLDMSPKSHQLIEAFDSVGGVEDLLCFSTDYPHWDADDPMYVARRLPKKWLPKVFYQNAATFYRWDVLALEQSTRVLRTAASDAGATA